MTFKPKINGKAKGGKAKAARPLFKKRHLDPKDFSTVLERIDRLAHNRLSDP